MKIRKLTPDTVRACAEEAADVLKEGGVILFPTDTLYGLGADAFSDEAVAKIYEIKGRNENKPIHGIASGLGMIETYGSLNPVGKRIAKNFFPGPLTLILEKNPTYNSGITKDIATIGFRIPDNEFCVETAKKFGRPFTATSANKSGQKPGRSLGPILAQLGAAILLIDVVFDAGELPESPASTVIDVSGGDAVVLREGAIPPATILSALS
jgi:L-threonylcarbamoyladenylate synthase